MLCHSEIQLHDHEEHHGEIKLNENSEWGQTKGYYGFNYKDNYLGDSYLDADLEGTDYQDGHLLLTGTRWQEIKL